MAEYIEREALIERLEESHEYHARNSREEVLLYRDIRIINEQPAADVVEVETVAQMLCDAMGDECPCNFCPTDEWLPEVCELQDECPNPKEKLGCWKQYIKHYGERRADNEESERS